MNKSELKNSLLLKKPLKKTKINFYQAEDNEVERLNSFIAQEKYDINELEKGIPTKTQTAQGF